MPERVDVVLPEIGESIFVLRIGVWFKQVGDPVTVDEPLFTVTTDKTDFEVAAPATGVLVEIRGAVGEPLPPLSVVGVIER